MYSNETILSVHSFLIDTPESSLRKMLVGSDLTEPHFRLLMKVVKGAKPEDFVKIFTDETLSLRLSPAEIKIKENFWNVCKSKLNSLGLLNLGAKAA